MIRPHELVYLSIYDNDSESWNNYSEGIINIDIERGNQEYNGPFTFPDTGTATFVIRNAQLDPYVNTLVRYNSKIAVRAATTRIFTGYIEGINVEYQPAGEPPIITIKAIDIIGLLAKYVLPDEFITQNVNWTTVQLLQALAIEIPEFVPTIFTDGTAYANGPIAAGTTALDAIRDRVKTDFGSFSPQRNGLVTYRRYDISDPLHIFNQTGSVCDFRDDGTGESYISVNLTDGFSKVINDIELNGINGTTVYANNLDSINSWGRTSAAVKLITDDTTDIQIIADKALDELAQPQRELTQITTNGIKDKSPILGGIPKAAFPTPYQTNVDVYHTVSDGLGGTLVIDKKYQVVGIKQQITYNDWIITLTLRNPVYPQTTSNPIIVRTPEQGTQLTEFIYSFIYPDLNEITAISWDADDGFTGTDPTITVDYVTGGTKTVTLTLSTIYGYDKTVTVLFYVGDQLPTSSFTYTSNADNIYTFNFTGTGATSVLWSFGDGTQSTEFNPTKYFLNTGTVTVSCAATNYVGTVTSAQTISVNKITVIPVKYVRLKFIKPNNATWQDDDAYRLATIYPTPGGQQMRGFSSFVLYDTAPSPDVVIPSTYTLVDYKEYGGCFVYGPFKDAYGRIQRLSKQDVINILTPNTVNGVSGTAYPFSTDITSTRKMIEITFSLNQEYTNISGAQFIPTTVGQFAGSYAEVEVSRDNVTWYYWGTAPFGGGFNYANPAITRPNWNLGQVPSTSTPKGVRFFRARTQFIVGTAPDYRLNEFIALGPGLRVNNGSFTYSTFPPIDNTITDCVGFGGIDLDRNIGASLSLQTSPTQLVYNYRRTSSSRNVGDGTVANGGSFINMNYKDMKNWARWDDGASNEITILMDLGQIHYDISGVYLDWRQDNDYYALPLSNTSSTSLSTANVIDIDWSDDGVTWYPMVTNEPMLRTPNNGAFIVKTTPEATGYLSQTWSPPITEGSTFVVDSMNATTNPPLKYVFP